jgi:hypothetical protein
MSLGRRSGDAGENLSLWASSQSEVETLDATISGLADLDADQLRLQWRNHLGGAVPIHLPRWLLMRVLAYRLQAASLGDLEKAAVRIIRASRGNGIDSAGGRPFNNRQPRTRDGIGLNSGALLVREWKGKLERVMVLDAGFAWKGKTFTSLSQVAKAITGTSWNGHRFFGLRSVKDQGPNGRVARPSTDEDRRSEVDQSKDAGSAESRDDGREEPVDKGRNQTDRPLKRQRPVAGLSGPRRIGVPEPEPPVPVDGEPRENIAEGSP